jgi:hypothetical protein
MAFFQLRPAAHVFTAGLLAEDLIAPFSSQSAELPVEILPGGRHPGVADFAQFLTISQAVRHLHVKPDKIRGWIKNGPLRKARKGAPGRNCVRTEDVVRLAAERELYTVGLKEFSERLDLGHDTILARYQQQGRLIDGRWRWSEAFVAGEMEYCASFTVSQRALARRMDRSEGYLSSKLELLDPNGQKYPFVKKGRRNYYRPSDALDIEIECRAHHRLGEDAVMDLAGGISDEQLLWLIVHKPSEFPRFYKRRMYLEHVWLYWQIVPWCRKFSANPEEMLTPEQLSEFHDPDLAGDRDHLDRMARRRRYEEDRDAHRKKRRKQRRRRVERTHTWVW